MLFEYYGRCETEAVNQREIQCKNKIYAIKGKLGNKNSDDSKNLFRIIHQNIRGIEGKTEDLMISLHDRSPNI
jgi:hypothetical protein